MVTNRHTQTARLFGRPLAMLDFVVRPQLPTSSSPIGAQWRWRAPSLPAVVLCGLLSGISACNQVAPSSPQPSRAEVRQERKAEQSKMDAARQELEQIPPPS